jgi:hypothetical protein
MVHVADDDAFFFHFFGVSFFCFLFFFGKKKTRSPFSFFLFCFKKTEHKCAFLFFCFFLFFCLFFLFFCFFLFFLFFCLTHPRFGSFFSPRKKGMLVVGFVGLPCAGKSTVINSIVGKRVLQSGVCRTTTVATVVGAKAPGAKEAGFTGAKKVEVAGAAALVSDDGVEFCAIDLPGIADAENTGSGAEGNFTALALKWASECDVVVWVTDARTAFLTTHETREFEDMRRALEKIADEDGKLFQFCILLAKYETDETGPTGPTGAAGAIGPTGAIKARAGEITRPTEHSTIADHEARIRGLFGLPSVGLPSVGLPSVGLPSVGLPSVGLPSVGLQKVIPQGIVIAKFSAHNRIARSSSASAALKALVHSSSGATGPKAHTTFDLKWATEDLPERRLAQMKRALCAAKSRAAVSSKYRAEVEASMKALSGSARLCDVIELGRRAAYAATAAVIITSCLVLCLAMHIAGLLVSSVRRVSLVSVPAAVPKVLAIVVGLYFLAQCATSLEFSSLTRHDGTSPSERAEETDPSWAASCTFRPDYAPVCETAYPGKWYLKLAEQGKLRNAREQYELGKMYYEGKGVSLDLTEAARWYRESASQGNADAQRALRSIERKPASGSSAQKSAN